ncbi:MAG: aminoacyl-tRNA hydrolase [Mycoplasmataceae bacterium]|jgi:PTH1 family peptidyl-tRNA hydrolase|nr:aminoacyl-tRNA hydrolase [Mycoplasmataceae bacterium]
MKLIVGLGNFPEKYKVTRHNVGFLAVDEYCKKNKLKLNNNKFNGIFFKDNNYIIAKPYTLMNLSGQFIKAIIDFFKIEKKNILVICDDINLDIGRIKIKNNGSGGGHNGLNNIFELLKTEEIKRIKIGVSKKPKEMILSDYVLSNFSKIELEKLAKAFTEINNVIDEFIGNKVFEKIMLKYNA